jgi:protein arginine N-methyltransferase 1
VRSDPHFEGFGEWRIEAGAVVDGFVIWFESELCGGERFSAGPGPHQTVHGCLYVPLLEPMSAPGGSTLGLRFCAIPVGADYTWTWESRLDCADGGTVLTPRQSSLSGLVLTPQRLRSMSESHRPTLGRDGRRWRAVIALAEGARTTGEIAAELAAMPGLGFASQAAAFDWLQRVIAVLEAGSATPL